ncbi:MAG: winged helix DNA-binding domain-containing protein [Candidatus Levyibacteriota bacterium]
MNENELRALRIANQQLSTSHFETPEELVSWFGAVQAQDYYGSLWGIGLRLRNTTQAAVEKSLTERKIVRSWPMRGTLHFTAAEDLKWLLKLLAQRVTNQNAFRYRQLELDEEIFNKSRKNIETALAGNKQLSRPEIYKLLNDANIVTYDQRGIHILGKLARECVICFGVKHGKQQTFVLFDEWISSSKELTKVESLAELAKRYFQSHGPATLQDFVWWTGLTMADAKIGLETIKTQFESADFNGHTYWFPRPKNILKIPSEVLLLPSYDEYTVAYKDRSAVLDPQHAKNNDTGNGIFHPPIVIDGQVVGLWKRAINKKGVHIEKILFRELSSQESQLFDVSAQGYANFIKSIYLQ